MLMKMSTFPLILTDISSLMDKVHTGPFASVSHGMSNETNIILKGINLNRHTSQQAKEYGYDEVFSNCNCIPLHLLLH